MISSNVLLNIVFCSSYISNNCLSYAFKIYCKLLRPFCLLPVLLHMLVLHDKLLSEEVFKCHWPKVESAEK